MTGRPAEDLTERVFGRLEVIGRHETLSRDGKVQWDCVCLCGKKAVVIGRLLKIGATKSCGCYRRDIAAARDAYGVRSYKKFVRL